MGRNLVERELKALTRLYAANSRTLSLKTTIPEAVVEALKAKAGDTVEWIIDSKRVEVKKVE